MRIDWKKTRVIYCKWVSTMLCALLLSACGGVSRQSVSSSDQPENSRPDAASPQSNSQAVQFLSHDPDWIGYQACTEDGMYYVVIENGAAKLKYWSRAEDQDIYLCASPNCEHRDASCTAFLTDTKTAPQVVATKQHLFLLYEGFYDPSGVQVSPIIEIADLNGGNRRILHEFDANQEIGAGIAGNDDELYFILSTLSTNDAREPVRISALTRLDISTAELQELQTWDDADVFLMAANDFDLVYKTIGMNTDQHTFFCYDKRDKTTRELARYAQEECAVFTAGSYLFRFSFGEKQIDLDVENWEDGNSFQLKGCFDCATGGAGLRYDGLYRNWLFVSTVTGYTESGNLIVKQYAIDLLARTITEIRYEDAVRHRPVSLTGTVGREQDELLLEQNVYSGTTDTSWTGTIFAVMPIEDFIAGNSEPRQITQ